MALLGGGVGGAGNPVGGSFTGPALALEYIGNHVYALSGAVDITQSDTTMLSFKSPESSYIVASIQINYAADQAENAEYKVSFNGGQVQGWIVPGGGGQPSPEQPLIMLIPPSTEVVVEAKLLSGGSSRTHYASLVGERYRDPN